MNSLISRAALVTVLGVTLGCSSSTPERSYETVVPSVDDAPTLAMFESKGRLVLARNGKLSILDPATSTLKDVGDASYQRCANDGFSATWPDLFYPTPTGARATADGAIELTNDLCGMWRVDVDDPSHPRLIVATRGGEGSLLGTTVGPKLTPLGMYAGDAGPETIVCIGVQGTLVGDLKDPAAIDHVEVWSIGADGKAERLATPPPLTSDSEHVLPASTCTGLAADADGIFFSAANGSNAALYRVDRPAKVATTVLRWTGSFPPMDNSLLLTKDAVVFEPFGISGTDPAVAGLSFPNDSQPILRIDRATLTTKILVDGVQKNAPLRYDLKIVADHAYFLDGFSLRRVALAGGDVETVVDGNADTHEGAFVDYAIVGSWVYFNHLAHVDGKSTYSLMRTPL